LELSIGKERSDPGFTVLELLIVMMILALTAVAVAVAIPDVFDRMSVDRAADRLERELTAIAEEALRTGQDQTVTLRQLGSSLTAQTGDRTVELGSAIAAKWTAAAEAGSNQERAAIVFWGLGGASGGTFELLRGNAQATIDVDWLTARIQRRN
jgi:general secretion pathway protein H